MCLLKLFSKNIGIGTTFLRAPPSLGTGPIFIFYYVTIEHISRNTVENTAQRRRQGSYLAVADVGG